MPKATALRDQANIDRFLINRSVELAEEFDGTQAAIVDQRARLEELLNAAEKCGSESARETIRGQLDGFNAAYRAA